MMRRVGVVGVALVLVTAWRAEAQGVVTAQPLRAATEAPAHAASSAVRDSLAAFRARVPAGGKQKGATTAASRGAAASTPVSAAAGGGQAARGAAPPPPAPARAPKRRPSTGTPSVI